MQLIEQLIIKGRYDQITTQSSRVLINMVKKGRKRGKFELVLNRLATMDILDDVTFKVPINVIVSFKIQYDETDPNAFDVAGFADDDSIDLAITINPKYFPEAFSNLVPTIKEAMRHELEHVAQANGLRPSSEDFEDCNMNFVELKDPQHHLGRYFLLKHEVPAFVRGLYKAAKTRRETIDVTINHFLKDYAHRLKSGDQKRIRSVWFDYAKKNLPNAQWSGYL